MLVALLSFGSGCVEERVEATITVVNESDYVITELYLTEVNNPNWGANLLATGPLRPGERLRLGVGCDRYDAELVDEQGVECKLTAINLCDNAALWRIYNNTCVAFQSARSAAEDSAATATSAKDPPAGAAAS